MVVRVWPCFSSAAAAVHHAHCTVQDFKHFLDTSGRELAQTHEFLVRARLAASSVTHLSSHTPHGHRCSGVVALQWFRETVIGSLAACHRLAPSPVNAIVMQLLGVVVGVRV